MRLAATLVLIASTSSAFAHEWRWETTSLSSAELAGTGWELTDTIGLSRPGETEKVVTFWTGTLDGKTVILRCIARVILGGISDEETCELPVYGE